MSSSDTLDPTLKLGLQYGGSLLSSSSATVHKKISRWCSLDSLKSYFAVSNGYVLVKLGILFNPFRSKLSFRRKTARSFEGGPAEYQPPRNDSASPDLYIPLMALLTYVLLVGLFDSSFSVELLGLTLSKVFALVLTEVLVFKFAMYLLSVASPPSFFDLVCYSGYKFVGIILLGVVQRLLGTVAFYAIALYWGAAIAVFMYKTFRRVLMLEGDAGSSVDPLRRYFLLSVSCIQIPLSIYMASL